jgi:hypothetical protein
MIFSELHWIPSVIAAVLTVLLVFVTDRNKHKVLSYAMAFSALAGLIGLPMEAVLALSVSTLTRCMLGLE